MIATTGRRVLRPGHTIVELLVILVMTGVVLSLVIPHAVLTLDRLNVHTAAREVVSTIESARSLALAGHAAVAVDVTGGTLRVRRGSEIILTREIAHTHGVVVWASRDSLSYDPYGLGHGAANLSVVLRRREAAETVFVSRLGRVR